MRILSNIVVTSGRQARLDLVLLLGLALVGGAPRGHAAPPPNDSFAAAIPISGFWGTTNGSTVEATAEQGEPSHAGRPAQNSVWYAYTPTMDGTLVVHTFGSLNNTRLAVYTFPVNTNGNIATLFPVAANDDLNLAKFNLSPNPYVSSAGTMKGPNGPALNNGPSFVRFPVKMGSTYYIAVDGSADDYSLTWGYNFAGLFYMAKPQSVFPKGMEEGKGWGNEFAVSRAFGAAGRVTVQGTTVDYGDTNYLSNPNYVPAIAGMDYADGAWSVTFDDYEMTKTFTIGTLDWGLTNANLHFLVVITNIVFDPTENTNLIAPPLILKDPASRTDFSVSVGRMLDWYEPKGIGDLPYVFPLTNASFVVNIGAKHYVVNEHNGPSVGIPFTRDSAGKACNVWWGINSSVMDKYRLGDLHNNNFDLWPESDYATPPPPDTTAPGLVADFKRTGDEDPQRGGRMSGTIRFGEGDTTVWLWIPIVDDNLPEFNEDFRLEIIANPDEKPPSAVPGEIDTCIITIANDPDDQPAGGLEYTWNPSRSASSQPPNNLSPGANGIVMALAVQPDQKAVIGGQFTAYNSYLRNNIARVDATGRLDTSFNPGNGADGVVSAVAIQPDGKILLAGDFFSVGGVDRYGVARLTPSGPVDLTFNPGVGADDAVWSMALGQMNGTNSIVLGGQFYSFNDLARTHVVKLDSQGQVDPLFDTSQLRLDGIVWAVALQADGKVVIGGDFTSVNGLLRPHIARLNADGSLDTSFDPGLGANDAVYALQVQPDGNILVGGAFTQFHIAAHHGVTRLQPSGALDPTFSPGSAANGVVYAVYLSSADGMIYVGGKFTSFNGTRRMSLARLFTDGTVDTGFLDTAYNQYAGFINPGFNPDRYPTCSVYAIGLQNFGGVADVLVGGNFVNVGGGNTTPAEHELQRHSQDVRRGLALLRGGATVGPGNITLSLANYTVDDYGQHLWVTQARTNGTLGIIGTRFAPDPLPVGSGAAIYGLDYTYNPVQYGLSMYSTSWGWYTPFRWQTRMLSDGVYDLNINPNSVVGNIQQPPSFNNCDITIPNLPGANRSFSLNLDTPWQYDTFFLGGANIPLGTALGAETTTSTMIVGSAKHHGTFSFITTNYSVSEGVGTADILVLRTNGTDDQATLDYFTYDLPLASDNARSNVNYTAVTKTTPHTLTFQPGIVTNSFKVKIIQDHIATPDLKLLLVITNFQPADVQGGITNAYLTIVDQDFTGGHLNLSAAAYVTNETAGAAVVTVTRTGSSQGSLTVDFYTTNTIAGPNNTPAVAGTNYFPVATNLSWGDGDSSPRVIVIPVLHDGLITTNLTVGLVLSSPTLNGLPNPGTLGPVSSAVLTILNVDQTGTVNFSRPSYNQNENGAYAIIPVVRQGGLSGTITVNFTASGVSAVAGADFVATNGSLAFGPGELCKVFTVPLLDNATQDGIRQVALTLSGGTPTTNVLGNPQVALLNIMDDETYNEPPGVADSAFTPLFDGPVNSLALQPDGKIVAAGAFTVVNAVTRHYVARLNPDSSLDYTFAYLPGGANGPVRSLALQSDGRMLIGGEFTNYDTSVRNYFARLNLDGTVEVAFNPGSGLNGFANSVVETFTDTNRTSRKILVGGNFTLANGVPRNYLAQFDDNGTLDARFNVNSAGPGLDGQVWAVAVQPDLKVVIGGDFQSINGVSRKHVARLNQDGSLDLSFNPGTGANDSVRALAIQLDGRIVVGGLFTNFNGTPQNYYTRLNADGSLDASFHGGVGADGPVLAIALQPDTRILLGGAFNRCSGVTRHRLTRLNPDGTVDPAINFGNGFDSYVGSIVVQTNDYLLLGGGFTTYDDAPPSYLARIFGRSVAGSGRFQFTRALYGVDETGTNAVLTLRRRGGTDGTSSGPNVSVIVSVKNGTATNGVNFVGGLFTNIFGPGETYQSIVLPVMHDFKVTPDLTVTNQIQDIQPLGLVLGIGNQPLSALIISNVDSGVAFSAPTYAVAKNVQQGQATIPVYRVGSLRGTAQVDVWTTPGTALPYQRYLPTTNTLVFNPGDTEQKAFVRLRQPPDNLILGDTTVGLALGNAANTLIAAPSTATLTILETTTAPGTLAFAADSYSVSERATNVLLAVQRTSGKTGAVTVDYATAPDSAASGSLFVATNGTLTFADGETLKSIAVPIRYNPVALGNQTFKVNLGNVTGGASLGALTSSTVTVLEEDTGIQFDQGSVSIGKYETDGQVVLNVLRPYGTNGVTQVDYATTNKSALAGTNYVAVSGTLTFNPGVMLQSVSVPLIPDPRVTGDLIFGVYLSNPTGGAQLIEPTAVDVRLFDVEAGLSFTNATNSVLESAGTALLTVVCANANMSGTSTVAYATADGTAIAGRDYGFTNGVLAFWSDHLTNTIAVPILDNTEVNGNRSFTVNLFNATSPGQLVAPTNMTVTILDDDAGVSFASESYTVIKNSGNASVSVVRTGYTNSDLAVNFTTLDDSAIAGPGHEYDATNGVVTLAAGQMSTNIWVMLRGGASYLVDPDRTFRVQLSNAVVVPNPAQPGFGGSAKVVYPGSTAVTIVDTSGSLVVPAGSALVSESLTPANGMIDPGERVTLWFAFRVAGGLNVSNLQATLLATNNVTAPSGAQLYGPLVKNGPSASRQFSFTASGTNGQQIVPMFSLSDGTNSLGLVQFTYTLGTSTASFTNSAPIVINDFANATPYPSVITVTNGGLALRNLTVTLTNLSHSYPSDVDVLLVSPSGTNSYLMAECGGGSKVNNATLTFADAASTGLPSSGGLASGTYRPTSYAPAGLNLRSPAPTGPYAVGLSAFNGVNPLGDWQLYIIDDTPANAGIIANGWYMTLTTANPVVGKADLVTAVSAAPNPAVITSNITYAVAVTNFGPASAANVVLTNVLPPATTFVSSGSTPGADTSVPGCVIYRLGTLDKDAVARLTINATSTATNLTITNWVWAFAETGEAYAGNNTNHVSLVVTNFAADLAVSQTAAPAPNVPNGTLTYHILVSNLGPATAPNVQVVDTLPPLSLLSLASVSPNAYVINNGLLVFTNLGSLGSGTSTNLTITVHLLGAGTLENTVDVSSSFVDPSKGNNSDTVKTLVAAPPLSLAAGSHTLTLSWPAVADRYVLETATNLHPPVIWTQIANPPGQPVNGQYSLTLGTTNGTRFFRLRGPMP